MAVTTLKTPIYQKIGNVIRKILPFTTADQVEVTVSGSTQDLQTFITALNNAVSGQTVSYVVADIAARDAMDATTLHVGDQAWVIDASADSTVTSGGAKYICTTLTGDPLTPTWVKTSEAESMDLVVAWADIQNKPSSAVADIDAAVATVTALSGKVLAADTNGDLTLDGVVVGQKYGVYLAKNDTDVDFESTLAGMNLPDGCIVCSTKADNV